MENKELLDAIRQIVKSETEPINKRLENLEEDIQEVKGKTQSIEDRTQRIEDRTQRIEDKTQRIEDRVLKIEDRILKIEDRTQRIEDRTLKIEVTIENETNRNINLLMEAQSLNAEKMKNMESCLDDIDSSVIAIEAITVQNIKDIETLKRKAQ